MDTKIVIYSRHPQEIRQQKSSAPAFSAAAGRKLKKQDNNLFRTIQTTCGQNAQVLAGKPSLCYRATHHGMTGQTTMHPLPAPLNRHRRRRFTDVVEVGRPTSTMSVLTVACDVDNPLYGKEGAAYVFAPQKGATAEQVKELDARLRTFAKETEEKGIATSDDAFHPGAGAAGGLGYALLTYLGAELKCGIEVVMEASGFDKALEGADVVLTGEGCSDEQTTHGKVAAGVLEKARKRGVKTVLISGQIKDKEALVAFGFDRLYGINDSDERPLEVLMQPEVAEENIRQACQRMMEEGV